MLKRILTGMTVLAAMNVAAQSKHAAPSSLTYAGYGIFLPASKMKTGSMIGNGINFAFGHFQHIGKQKKISGKLRLTPGLEAKLFYSKFGKDLKAPAVFRDVRYYDGGSVQHAVLLLETEKKKPDAFQYLIGPALLMHFEHVFFQASVSAGYASVSQEKFQFNATLKSTSAPAGAVNKTFFSGGHETNNGWTIVPGIKAGIDLRKNLAAFISIDYSIGASQDFDDQVLLLASAPDANGVYSFQSLSDGVQGDVIRRSRLRTCIVNANLALKLNRR